ncbi:MAG: lipoyl synthase [Calditrichaeota bacterium]|nr:lipoyl synthase [Calditrichota bacterium]RQV98831.1 MAG: lipoyl synthase [Calditrichota bacterium]
MNKFNRKPEWLKVRMEVNKNFQGVRDIIQASHLHTVCEEAKCPNIHECWGRGTATFMILGDTCTRSCRFCAVKTGRPGIPDLKEPLRVARSVQEMKIKHVVITSVNRDELDDGGSDIWAATIRKVRELNPETTIEVLTPDFKGIKAQLYRVFDARPDIFSHNLETVPRLYRKVRPQARYERSLEVLKESSQTGLITKTGIMVGLGERFDEIISLMEDTVKNGVDILTIGQYLQPTMEHLPVSRYVPPEEFEKMQKAGIEVGLKHVESGPLVRSSYHSEEQYEKLTARRARVSI